MPLESPRGVSRTGDEHETARVSRPPQRNNPVQDHRDPLVLSSPVPGRPTLSREHMPRGRKVLRPAWVGGFFVWTAGIHVGIVAADTGFYRHFADEAFFPAQARAWRDVFMTH